jgi:hypothetical protein
MLKRVLNWIIKLTRTTPKKNKIFVYEYRKVLVEELKSPNGEFKCWITCLKFPDEKKIWFQTYTKDEMNKELDKAIARGAVMNREI